MIKKPKNTHHITRKQFIIYNLVIIPILAILIGTAISLSIYRHYEDQRDPSFVRNSAMNALLALSDDAQFTPQNSTQYIPEFNLQFPASQELPHISYRYQTGDEQGTDQVVVTSSQIKDGSEAEAFNASTTDAFFDIMPRLQNCQRVFVLTKQDKQPVYPDSTEKVETIALENGENLYVWRNSDQLCRAAEHGVDSLQSLLTEAKSY